MPSFSSHLLPKVLDQLLDTVFLVDLQGHIVYVSAACERMFGYTQEEMMGRRLFEFVAPEDRERTLAESCKVIAGEPRIGFENRYLRKDGSHVPLMWSARLDPVEQLRVGVARDVSERKRLEARQAATYAISEAVHDAVSLDSLFEEVHRIMAGLVPMAGFAVLIRQPVTGDLTVGYRSTRASQSGHACDLSDGELRQLGLASMAAGLDPSADVSPGTNLPAEWLAVPLLAHDTIGALVLRNPSGKAYEAADCELVNYVSTQVATAIRRKQMAAELERLARNDELTGLLNRRAFQERVPGVMARCRRRARQLALLFIDINDFKRVNDRHGHVVGDHLLRAVARRLEQCLREDDAVFRLGGDEFVVLLEEVRLPDDVEAVARKIEEVISEPLQLGGIALNCAVSVGRAIFPLHGDSLEALLSHADRAMYARKRTAVAER